MVDSDDDDDEGDNKHSIIYVWTLLSRYVIVIIIYLHICLCRWIRINWWTAPARRQEWQNRNGDGKWYLILGKEVSSPISIFCVNEEFFFTFYTSQFKWWRCDVMSMNQGEASCPMLKSFCLIHDGKRINFLINNYCWGCPSGWSDCGRWIAGDGVNLVAKIYIYIVIYVFGFVTILSSFSSFVLLSATGFCCRWCPQKGWLSC